MGGYESESATHKRDVDRQREREREKERERECVYLCASETARLRVQRECLYEIHNINTYVCLYVRMYMHSVSVCLGGGSCSVWWWCMHMHTSMCVCVCVRVWYMCTY